MTYPETVWEYSAESEAKRVVFVAEMIQSYFYQKKGFLVLPEIATKSVNTIFFPNLPIVHHQIFWERVRETATNEGKLPLDIAGQLKNEIVKATPPTLIRGQWEKCAPQFWRELNQFLPEIASKITRLTIRQTAYGSRASSVRKDKALPGEVTIYLRFDAQISHIPAAIFIATLDNVSEKGLLKGFTWEERQSIGDFLMRHTSLAKIFPHHESTILSVRKDINESLRQKAKNYVTELGFPPKQLFEVNENNQVVLNKKCITLRPNEQHVFSLLIEKRNQIVTTEEIAARLWSTDTENRFSLYAISKVVERLRKQVQAVGIFPGIIETRRGQGFVLND